MKLFFPFSKQFIFLCGLLWFSVQGNAQVGINTDDPKAALDVVADDSGILIPRVPLTAKNIALPVVAPIISELIYNTATSGAGSNSVSPGFYYWNGNNWVSLSAGGAAPNDNKWDLSGNAATTAGTNFVGTTDKQALHFKTDNTTRLIIPNADQIRANSRGTASFPFYSFVGDTVTGIYSPSPKFLSIATDGAEKIRFGSGTVNYITSFVPQRIVNGEAAIPALAFDGSRTTGLYRAGSNIMGFSTAGAERMRISNIGIGINGSISIGEGNALTFVNGLNSSISLGTYPFSQYRITGPSANFSLGSIIPIASSDGQVITLINTTNFPFTIIHNHTGTTDQSLRIYCPKEADFVLNGKYSTVTLQYNKTLLRWVITNAVDGTNAPYGSNIQSVKGITDTSINSVNFADMQGMTLTFTPTHSTVYVSFSASGYMDVSGTIPENAGAAFRLINVTNGNRVEAGISVLATDYDSDTDYYGNFYEGVISAWNAGLNMFPVTVTPGVSTTLKVQWSRDALAYAKTLRCDVVSDPDGAHRSMTIFD